MKGLHQGYWCSPFLCTEILGCEARPWEYPRATSLTAKSEALKIYNHMYTFSFIHLKYGYKITG